MSWVTPFAWGVAIGWVAGMVRWAIHDIRAAKRDAKAKIEAAKRRAAD